jgi:hypothetical protein
VEEILQQLVTSNPGSPEPGLEQRRGKGVTVEKMWCQKWPGKSLIKMEVLMGKYKKHLYKLI